MIWGYPHDHELDTFIFIKSDFQFSKHTPFTFKLYIASQPPFKGSWGGAPAWAQCYSISKLFTRSDLSIEQRDQMEFMGIDWAQ